MHFYTAVFARTSAGFPVLSVLQFSPRTPSLVHKANGSFPYSKNRIPASVYPAYVSHGLSDARRTGEHFLSSAPPDALPPRQRFPALFHGFFRERKIGRAHV